MGTTARAPHLFETVRSCKALKRLQCPPLDSAAPLHCPYPPRFVDPSRKLFESPVQIGHTISVLQLFSTLRLFVSVMHQLQTSPRSCNIQNFPSLKNSSWSPTFYLRQNYGHCYEHCYSVKHAIPLKTSPFPMMTQKLRSPQATHFQWLGSFFVSRSCDPSSFLFIAPSTLTTTFFGRHLKLATAPQFVIVQHTSSFTESYLPRIIRSAPSMSPVACPECRT
jgi:hypothetical protein